MLLPQTRDRDLLPVDAVPAAASTLSSLINSHLENHAQGYWLFHLHFLVTETQYKK